MSYFKKIFAATIVILIAVFAFVYLSDQKSSTVGNNTIQEARPVGPVPDKNAKDDFDSSQPSVPSPQNSSSVSSNVSLEVPFLSQAPFAVWDPLHEDACEEASLIMVKHFLDKDSNITPASGDVEIRKMIQYEEQNGYGLSITMDQLAEIIRDYYGMKNYRVEKNISIENIKRELAAGRPVIVPAAGKLLNNPNFRDGGPVYHMLVIKGYDKSGFITNDPGTRKGEGFRYTFDTLYNAIHDWDEQNILNGQKAYLVFDDPA